MSWTFTTFFVLNLYDQICYSTAFLGRISRASRKKLKHATAEILSFPKKKTLREVNTFTAIGLPALWNLDPLKLVLQPGEGGAARLKQALVGIGTAPCHHLPGFPSQSSWIPWLWWESFTKSWHLCLDLTAKASVDRLPRNYTINRYFFLNTTKCSNSTKYCLFPFSTT